MKKLICLYIIIFTISCNSNQKKREAIIEARWEYFVNDYHQNKKENDYIFLKAKDTVQRWIDLQIESYSLLYDKNNGNNYGFLSYVFLNTERNKCVLYMPTSYKDSTVDGIRTIIGEKYEGNWWFYPGATFAALRGSTGDYSRKKEPKKLLIQPTIESLRKRAIEIAMGWYYKEIETDSGTKYIINDKAFEDIYWKVDRIVYLKDYLKENIPDTLIDQIRRSYERPGARD